VAPEATGRDAVAEPFFFRLLLPEALLSAVVLFLTVVLFLLAAFFFRIALFLAMARFPAARRQILDVKNTSGEAAALVPDPGDRLKNRSSMHFFGFPKSLVAASPTTYPAAS
jgi:hypothetical protein